MVFGAAALARSLPLKSRKELVHDVVYTSLPQINAGLVHDVTDKTVRHKAAALTTMLSPLSNVDKR